MEQKKDSELISLTSWIEGMLCATVRRGDAGVSFERDMKTRSIRSFSQDRTQLGAFLFHDWEKLLFALNDPRIKSALHRFLREQAERQERPPIPDADFPLIKVHSNKELAWCSFVHPSYPADPIEPSASAGG